jgi:hypothetical protein
MAKFTTALLGLGTKKRPLPRAAAARFPEGRRIASGHTSPADTEVLEHKANTRQRFFSYLVQRYILRQPLLGAWNYPLSYAQLWAGLRPALAVQSSHQTA